MIRFFSNFLTQKAQSEMEYASELQSGEGRFNLQCSIVDTESETASHFYGLAINKCMPDSISQHIIVLGEAHLSPSALEHLGHSRRSKMASVDRAMAKAAAALLPGLLPTPPRRTTTPCLIILPSSFASEPKPGRADSVERWGAHKIPRSPASSCGSSSPGRASSCERWDINKKIQSNSTSSSSSRGSNTLCEKWDSNKQRLPSRASSTDRWDTHKKARSALADAQSWTSEQVEREIGGKQTQEDEATTVIPTLPGMYSVFCGSSFFASPEPSMLPMPTFFRSRCPSSSMMPVT
jgi:amidophosphoribosyltransferase